MFKRFIKVIALLVVVTVFCGAVPAFSASKKAVKKKRNTTTTVNQTSKKPQNTDADSEFKELQAKAQKGDAEAQYQLGLLYNVGILYVTKNPSEALKWYRKAAEQGHIEAQASLGAAYYGNENYSEAVKWYRKAAEQGHADSLRSLGSLYEYGRGVKQNYAEAQRLYHKAYEQYLIAAEQGDAEAQFTIANRYHYGVDGVRPNFAEAEKWYNRAYESHRKNIQYGDETQKSLSAIELENIENRLKQLREMSRVSYSSSQLTTQQPVVQQSGVDVPDFYRFGYNVLSNLKNGVTDSGVYKYYQYRCGIGPDRGIAEQYVNELTSSYPFIMIKHYFRESKVINWKFEIWAFTYTGSKYVKAFSGNEGQDPRSTVPEYACHVRLIKRIDNKNRNVTFKIDMSNELTYGGDTNTSSAPRRQISSYSNSSQKIKGKCSRCNGSGKIMCSACTGRGGGYVYKDFRIGYGTGYRSSSKQVWQECSKCHGDGEVTCTSCNGEGYEEYYD